MIATKLIALCALFAGATVAQDLEFNQRVAPPDEFWKRGSEFKAPEDTKAGSSCDVAFGQGYITCREKSKHDIRLCYNPSIGQVCCHNKWGCPSDSYCLTEGLCCPTGADPAQCAGAYSVSLPTSLTTSDSGPPQTKPAPPPSSTTWTSTVTTSTPVTTYSANSSEVDAAGYSTTSAPAVVTSNIYIVPVPLHTAGNSSSLVTATTGYIPPSSTGKVPVYTGAASSNTQIGTWTGLAALIAIVGLL